jgi:hypothetical protein
MKKITILCIAIALFCIACKEKTKTTIIHGTVINTGSHKPIEGAIVTMHDGSGNTSGFFGSNHTTTGSGATQQITTGADGKFSFTFEGDAPRIWAEKEQYRFYDEGAYEIKPLTAGKTYDSLTLTMDAYAWFNPILKGHNSISTDAIWIIGGCRLIPPMGGVF